MKPDNVAAASNPTYAPAARGLDVVAGIAQARLQPGQVRGRRDHHRGFTGLQAVADEPLERRHETAFVVVDLHEVVARRQLAPERAAGGNFGFQVHQAGNGRKSTGGGEASTRVPFDRCRPCANAALQRPVLPAAARTATMHVWPAVFARARLDSQSSTENHAWHSFRRRPPAARASARPRPA
jgi:hypothetical protein